jgi:hypothetical protein
MFLCGIGKEKTRKINAVSIKKEGWEKEFRIQRNKIRFSGCCGNFLLWRKKKPMSE